MFTCVSVGVSVFVSNCVFVFVRVCCTVLYCIVPHYVELRCNGALYCIVSDCVVFVLVSVCVFVCVCCAVLCCVALRYVVLYCSVV